MRLFSVPLTSVILLAAVSCAPKAPNGNSWGDTGDGNYLNPILAADYSDPDAIRVGDTYYMVASDFHFLGMQVLESKDLVNWKLISQIYDRFDLPGWNEMKHYAGGSWAPSIRYHGGKFWVYFCTPDEGLFMSTAEDPAGPWTPLHCVKAVPKWEDPCPFWDEDGTAYLGHSLHGAGPIILHRMSADGKELLDDGVTIYEGPVAEGTKFHKIGEYYYLSIPEGGVQTGWQTVLRAKDIYGPYERKVVLETGSTDVNGPHQGAIVDTPYGEWWFLHFQYLDPLGRVVHLQPMHWEDGWPVMGEDYDGNGVGEPVKGWRKPKAKQSDVIVVPASSDDFSSPELGLQWQFNHNPLDSAWAVEDGRLRLDAQPAADFLFARNTLTQKVMGLRGSYTVKMDCSDMTDGQAAGLACVGQTSYSFGIRQIEGERVVFLQSHNLKEPFKEPSATEAFNGDTVWLRFTFDIKSNAFQFSYSTDGNVFQDFGEPFPMSFGSWKGVRAALYSYMRDSAPGIGQVGDLSAGAEPVQAGTAWFDDFVYSRED